MKKGLLFILMVGASVCLSAQEKRKTEGKAYTVETNRFGANWFIRWWRWWSNVLWRQRR